MQESFDELYRGLSKDIFLEKAREQLSQGQNALSRADTYAGQGKPDFVLAFLLLSNAADDVKRDIFARSYERRAVLSDEKAASFDQQFHRAFPLIKLGAQHDRMSAHQVRQGKRIENSSD
ncbi:MAG TPA: hypothetical protein VH593_07590, partial [Ktedonobacteraceae bacterium]